MAVVHQNGFSTAVRIVLEIGEQVLRVAQVGEHSLILKDIKPALFPPTSNARIVISVDGERRVHPVQLPNGIAGRVVFFENCDTCKLNV
jgi:hypothetical protein